MSDFQPAPNAPNAAPAAAPDAAYTLAAPAVLRSPLIFVSPHSGAYYPPAFVAASRLDAVALRGSEDAFVDELFAAAPGLGAPLLAAAYPRAYVDVNREPWELDAEMYDDELPDYVNTASVRVAGGLGTVARVVANGAEIYAAKLRFAEAERRVAEIYTPFHEALKGLIDQAVAAFGCAVIVDCHSMPSVGGPMDKDTGRQRAEIVLGDRFGSSCHAGVIRSAEATFREQGYSVGRNTPYAGGFTTRNYGRPAAGIHTLQIEINRGLYMDEKTITRLPGITAVSDHMTAVIEGLAALDVGPLGPRL